MEDLLIRTWEQLLGRREGPFWLRFVLQPLVAASIGVLIGLKDARAGRRTFVWRLVKDRLRRREVLREAWKDVAKVFAVAIVIDVIYQLWVLHWIHPLETLFVATMLAWVPYALVRSTTHLVTSFWLYRQTRSRTSAVARKSA